MEVTVFRNNSGTKMSKSLFAYVLFVVILMLILDFPVDDIEFDIQWLSFREFIYIYYYHFLMVMIWISTKPPKLIKGEWIVKNILTRISLGVKSAIRNFLLHVIVLTHYRQDPTTYYIEAARLIIALLGALFIINNHGRWLVHMLKLHSYL